MELNFPRFKSPLPHLTNYFQVAVPKPLAKQSIINQASKQKQQQKLNYSNDDLFWLTI